MSLTQHAFYIANQFECILYGIALCLYYMTLRLLLSKQRRRAPTDRFLITYSTVLIVLVTIPMVADKIFGEEMWIVNAGYPGGPDAYLAANAGVWYETMGTAATVLLNLLGDGLMVYRCHVLYGDYRLIGFPCFIWTATLALGIAQLYFDSAPNASSSWFAGLASHLGLAYYTTSISLNLISSCLIISRIFRYASKTRRSLGRDIAATYTGAMAIVIEAGLPYTLFGIAFLVAYGMNSGLDLLFGDLYVMFTCISPQMIIFRVASGRAWTNSTTAGGERPSSLGFSDRSRSVPLTTFHTTFHSDFTGTTVGDPPFSAGPLLDSPVDAKAGSFEAV